eukprot:8006950-Pyramimonas_sp.AAC.1
MGEIKKDGCAASLFALSNLPMQPGNVPRGVARPPMEATLLRRQQHLLKKVQCATPDEAMEEFSYGVRLQDIALISGQEDFFGSF